MNNYFYAETESSCKQNDGTFITRTIEYLIESESIKQTESILKEIWNNVGLNKIIKIEQFDVDDLFLDDPAFSIERGGEENYYYFILESRYYPTEIDDNIKKITTNEVFEKYFVQSDSVINACECIMLFKGDLPDFEITSCVMSNIEDVILAND
jgi:hypothetical protein